MFGQPQNNPANLRVIQTARTEEAINTAAKQGFRPLVKAVKPGRDIHSMFAVFQHEDTGEILVSGDCRCAPGRGYRQVLPYTHYYPYNSPNPFAAYLVPPDIQEGERVWLEDLIEDIVAVFGNQGWHPRLEACEAIWENGGFKIQFDPKKDAEHLIG